jgi:hypothetical protein
LRNLEIPGKRAQCLQLNDVDHRIPTLGEAAVDTVSRIEKLFARTPIIEISDSVKVRAAQRAIDKRAPFHRQRNGIDDAILIEVYADVVGAKARRSVLQHRGLPCALVLPSAVRCLRTGLTLRHVTPEWVLQVNFR